MLVRSSNVVGCLLKSSFTTFKFSYLLPVKISTKNHLIYRNYVCATNESKTRGRNLKDSGDKKKRTVVFRLHNIYLKLCCCQAREPKIIIFRV